MTQHLTRKTSSRSSSPHFASRDNEMVDTAKHIVSAGGDSVTKNPALNAGDSSPFHRIISIEEDHLPYLLEGEPYPLFHQVNEEDEEALIDLQMSPMCPLNVSLGSVTMGQPVGKEGSRKVKGAPKQTSTKTTHKHI